MAPCNGTTSTPPKLVVTVPPKPWHTTMAPCNGTQQRPPSPQSWSSPSPGTPTPQKLVVPSSTLQWHHVLLQSWSSPSPAPTIAHYNGTWQWHPAMAPRPLPQSWSSPPRTIAHYNGTLQWHHVLLQSWSSPSPRNDSALQWHLAMAPSNGTTSTPPKLVVTSPPTIAHYNGTLRWHSNGTTSSAPCSGTLVPRPIRQSGSSPSPPIGSKNPYSYRYLGNKPSKDDTIRGESHREGTDEKLRCQLLSFLGT